MYERFYKRIFDVMFSFVFLTLLLPVIAIIGFLNLLFLGRPVFFTQKRPGKNERVFTLIKFRSMKNPSQKKDRSESDPGRLNAWGLFIRKYSLDELPELINILKGDMSVVGPRPLCLRYLPYYKENERLRHSVRPGLTGLAQISGRNLVNWDERLGLDIEYVNKISFRMDLRIILNTIIKTIKSDGVVIWGTGKVDDLDIERSQIHNGY